MNNKITHGLKITAIIIAIFAAAAFTSVGSYVKASEAPAATDISINGPESTALHTDVKMIADNEMPLSAAPASTDLKTTLIWLVIATATIMSGIVIVEDCKDRLFS